MFTQIRKDTSTSSLVPVHGSCLGNGPAEHSSVRSPDFALWSVDLVNGSWMPDQHVTGFRAKFNLFTSVVFETFFLNVNKDGLIADNVVSVGTLEIYRSTVICGCFVHCDPETKCLVPENRSVLVVLVPLEALVWVHHQQICRYSNFLCSAALSQYVPNCRVVIKTGKGLVCLPDVSLDVIVQLRCSSCKGPKVRIFDLIRGCLAQIVDPLVIKHPLDVYNTVSFESFNEGFINHVPFWWCHTLDNSMWHWEFWILKSKVVFPKGWCCDNLVFFFWFNHTFNFFFCFNDFGGFCFGSNSCCFDLGNLG
mmetsp:Transcript_5560/g.8552  ORF Transcript_5560/g.8552 Transcript_5560/m.8552 type:complete len:308 (-) Transcript_5560:249-1172(-)